MENNYSANWKKRGDRTGLIRNALLKSMGYVPTQKSSIQPEVENFEDIIIEEEILGEED